jgi:DNA-binding winged helix-turn-helix (wHTH) protein
LLRKDCCCKVGLCLICCQYRLRTQHLNRKQTLVKISSATETRKTTRLIIFGGLVVIIGILTVTGAWLLWTLPDANAFNVRVEQIFVRNDALTSQNEINLLEILATSLLVAALAFLGMLLLLNRRMAKIESSGIQVSSLLISRDENLVILNNMEFQLTPAAIETFSVLAEARMDGDVLSGAELEAMIVGKSTADCDEAAGATRIKRLRDSLGNQMVSALLIKNIARRGYVLAIDKDVIEMI